MDTAFDPMGNRLTKTDSRFQTETYVSNAANMTISRNGQPYTYDANGNTLTGGGRTNIWDSANRLYSCVYSGNTNVFTYGSDGFRHTSVTNNTRTDYLLDGSNVIREMRDVDNDGDLDPIATYFSNMYKRDDTNGTIRWYIYDGLGSVLAEVDPSGNVTAGRKYDVYGLVRSGQTGISKHKFVGRLGHPSEDETGLIYMRARYMDPMLGKFVSEDPAGNGLNWYAYAGDNPVCGVDPDGKMTVGDALTSMGISGFLNGIMQSAIAGGNLSEFFKGFLTGAVGGFFAPLGPMGTAFGAFATMILDQGRNGVDFETAFYRALVLLFVNSMTYNFAVQAACVIGRVLGGSLNMSFDRSCLVNFHSNGFAINS